MLGLAESGEGGSDAFGLAGKPGGHELLLTGGGGGGNPNGRFLQFAAQLGTHVQAGLNEINALKEDCYVAEVEVRVGSSGAIETVVLRKSTGQSALDARIMTGLRELEPLANTPPEGMPWPVGLRVMSLRGDCTHR